MALEDLLHLRPLLAVLSVNREQDATVLDLAFVALALVLGNAGANERACQSSDHCTGRRAAQCGHDRSRRDEGPESGDGERADSGEPAERTAQDDAGTSARRRPFWRLAAALVREIAPPGGVREQDRHVIVREARAPRVADDGLCLLVGLHDAEYGFLHVPLLWLRNVELVHDVPLPCLLLRQPDDRLALARVVHRASQRDAPALGDDLHV